ncbi:GntR family transcriptional regulator [Persicobacter psychrovividus]|uniref:Transcriptional regulator n=1 Tax=Persicobacter psychrovividus TaxID=387638 RepID=A0ABM7VHW3_9BACT|nr:transcriptional regulator [Persicobacter psychrovividus]
MEYIEVAENSDLPKYAQIKNSIKHAIYKGELQQGAKLPSLNAIKKAHGVSQDTILLAYRQLMNEGLVVSTYGKGYFVAQDHRLGRKICLIFDKLTLYKEELYESIVTQFESQDQVDIFFHHNQPLAFQSLLEKIHGQYTDYLIIPFDDPAFESSIERLPQKRVFLLDRLPGNLQHQYGGVFQDFQQDTFNALNSIADPIKKYQRLVLLLPHRQLQMAQIMEGAQAFAQQADLKFKVVNSAAKYKLQAGDLVIAIYDKDLAAVMQQIHSEGFTLAQQVGVISYNDTPLKAVIGQGITCISTDFAAMGQKVSQLVKEQNQIQLKNIAQLIIRKSV